MNTDDYISWIQNELTFDNDKLADIIINLNKWYGVDIECPSEFAEKVFYVVLCQEWRESG